MAGAKVWALWAVASAMSGVSVVSCSNDKADRPTDNEAELETSVAAAPDCAQYPCVQDDPVNGATHKIGDIYLRIPDEFLGRPVETINTGDALGLNFCRPDIHGDLATCAPVSDRISLHLRPAPGPNPNWYQQTTKRLADLKSRHAGPFQVADTKIDEYRVHSSDMTVYYVFNPNDAEAHYLFARCFSRVSCRVHVRDYLGLTLQY